MPQTLKLYAHSNRKLITRISLCCESGYPITTTERLSKASSHIHNLKNIMKTIKKDHIVVPLMTAEDVTEAGWNDKVLSQDHVAVEFWAPWCPFCVRLGPVFDKVSDEVSDTKFVKVNVQDEQSIASKYGVQGIPVIKFFCHGKEVGSVLGFRNIEQLKRDVERVRAEDESCVANSSEMKQ